MIFPHLFELKLFVCGCVGLGRGVCRFGGVNRLLGGSNFGTGGVLNWGIVGGV